MKYKQIIIFILFFYKCFLFSQNQKGVAVYKLTLTLPSLNVIHDNNRRELYKELQEKIKKASENTTYELSFNNTQCVFEPRNYLSLESSDFGGKILNSGLIFNNVEGLKITQRERSGTTFLIQSNSRNVKWKILNITKKIGKFLCYKAIANNELKKGKYQDITAWYCPDLPFSFGPMGFANLPGLILELNFENKRIYTLKNITLNLDNNIEIKKPTKGKKVTEEEYREISKKMYYQHTGR